jgi:hypothetical protein
MFSKIKADTDILNAVSLTMMPPDPIDGFPGGSDPSTQVLGKKIPLQFPPRVKTTSKAGNYEEQDSDAYEPVAVWKGSKGTNMTVELTYVVTGGAWNVAGVSSAVHTVMSYFYRDIVAGQQKAMSPLLQVRMYEVAPFAQGQISTWRVLDASVSYSDEIILDGSKAYHQKATVTMNLMMYTRIFDRNEKAKQDIESAVQKPLKEWY